MTQKKERKHTLSRREFLQRAGLVAGGGAVFAATSELWLAGVARGAGGASGPVTAANPKTPLPPHRAISVAGTHAYADKLSVKPGDTINFYVSSDSSYTMQIFRLGPEPDRPISDQSDPDCDKLMSDVMPASPSPQPIYPGSYVHVKNGLAAKANLTALTLECWVRPSRGRTYDVFNYSGLIAQCDLPDGPGYGLFVRFAGADVQGNSVAFYLGDGVNQASVLEVPVNFPGVYWQEFKWHHVVATWDGTTKKVWIDGEQKGTQSYAGSVLPGPAPLRLAASGANGEANHFLNGDLAMPVIYDRALSEAEILSRFNQQFDQQK